jgi:hypothetical protein
LCEEARRRSFRDILTAGVFDKLTPGWGFIAPVGVEFGLLYAAVRRKAGKIQKESLPWTLWALETLLSLTAMLVNGAGAFSGTNLPQYQLPANETFPEIKRN